MSNELSRVRRQQILSEYRRFRKEKYTHSQAVGQLSENMGHHRSTIESAIDKELKSEEYEVRIAVVEKAEANLGMDWKPLIPVAIANFMGALYGFDELTTSQTWATKEVLKKIEEAKKTTGEKPPEAAFDND